METGSKGGRAVRGRWYGQTRKGLNKKFSQVNAVVARKGGRGIRWAGSQVSAQFSTTFPKRTRFQPGAVEQRGRVPDGVGLQVSE